MLEDKHFELAELPSKILADYIKMKNEETKQEDLESLAQHCYLRTSEVKFWLEHSKQVSENGKRGAKTAADIKRKQRHLTEPASLEIPMFSKSRTCSVCVLKSFVLNIVMTTF